MSLPVKRLHKDAKLPTRAYEHAAGYDLYSVEDATIFPGQTVKVATGIAVAIPEGKVGLIEERSGLAKASLARRAGVIDSV